MEDSFMPITKYSIRRTESIRRDNKIHLMLSVLYNELGDLKSEVSMGYIYRTLAKRAGLSERTISFILNHTKYIELK